MRDALGHAGRIGSDPSCKGVGGRTAGSQQILREACVLVHPAVGVAYRKKRKEEETFSKAKEGSHIWAVS